MKSLKTFMEMAQSALDKEAQQKKELEAVHARREAEAQQQKDDEETEQRIADRVTAALRKRGIQA